MKKSILLSSFLFLALFVVRVSASEMGQSLNLLLTPERPGANAFVEARLESYTANLDRADISWLLDGKLAKQGIGETTLSFTTEALGSETTLGVNIKTFDGNFLNQTIRIRPAEVALLWQAYSYTPPFYKGKALLPIQGTASVVAFPSFITRDGEALAPEQLIYTWRENNRVSGDGSGYGKFSFAVKGKVPIRPITVGVEAIAPDYGLVAAAETTIMPIAPQILFYEDKPLLGRSIRNALKSDFAFNGDEMRISAVPFFFETTSRVGTGLTYEWSVNNAPSPERGPDLVLRRSGSEAGRAQLLLNVTSPASIFQAAEALANIIISASPFGTQ